MVGAEGATILHADLDAFYASVEQLLDPSLRGRPVAVGGGVVLAASYEAKSFGVAAGMAGWRARRLCPGLRFVGGHFREYQRLADQVMSVLRDFTPLVERISIDEAFLDVRGSVHLFGAPPDIAAALRHRVRADVGLAVSVGVARTKHLAKIASQVAKPDGLVVVDPGRELEFLTPLPVELVWGVGPATRGRLAAVGIHTIGELAATPTPLLQGLVGRSTGARLGALANDIDPRRIDTGRRVASMGAQAALGRRRPDPELIGSTVGYLSDRVAARLRAAGRAGRTVSVRVRFAGMRSVTRSTTLRAPVSATRTLTEVGTELVAAALAGNPSEREISLLGLAVSQLRPEPPVQLELPLWTGRGARRPGSAGGSARRAADRAVDSVRGRFGRHAVGYAGVVLSTERHVPEEFRELAEHGPGDA